MKHFLALSIFMFIVGFMGNAYAPNEQKIKVFVEILINEKEKDEIERQIIENNLKRELIALGDVQIVDKKDDWQFRIMINVLGARYQNGGKAPQIAIATSYQVRVPKTFFRTYNFDLAIPVLSEKLDVSIWPRDNLPTWCIKISEYFSENMLAVFREHRALLE